MPGSSGIEHPRAGQDRGPLARGDAAKQRQMNRSAEKFGEVHLQPAQREQARRMERIGLDDHVDVAIGAEPICQNGAEQEKPHDANTATRIADSRKIKGYAVQVEHDRECMSA